MPLSLRHQNTTLMLMWHGCLDWDCPALISDEDLKGVWASQRHKGSCSLCPDQAKLELCCIIPTVLTLTQEQKFLKVGVQFCPHICCYFGRHLSASLSCNSQDISPFTESTQAQITPRHSTSYQEMTSSTWHAYNAHGKMVIAKWRMNKWQKYLDSKKSCSCL